MDLMITRVVNHGDASEEYVLLEVSAPCQLNRYALYDATYTNDHKISNKQRHFFRFPPKDVDAGDWVSLRTGKGKNGSFVNENGKTVHRFYWNLNHPVWNDDGDAAVLIKIADWKTKAAG
jgi:hypothetical protein